MPGRRIGAIPVRHQLCNARSGRRHGGAPTSAVMSTLRVWPLQLRWATSNVPGISGRLPAIETIAG